MNRNSFLPALLALIALFSVPGACAAADDAHVEASLVAEQNAFTPGENWVALRLKPDSGWHTYWQNPGDSGLPTKLEWTLPDSISAGAIHWPYPQRFALGGLAIYGYGAETLHLVPIEVPANWPQNQPLTLHAKAQWLVCADVCIPGKADLTLTLPVHASAQADPRWAAEFAAARAALPLSANGWDARFGTDAHDYSMSIANGSFAPDARFEFFPLASDLVNHAAAQRVHFDHGTLRLSQSLSSYFVSAPKTVDGVLEVSDHGKVIAYSFSAQPGAVAPVAITDAAATPVPATADQGLLLVLLSALLGGILLNLMPCVFPVLSLKALSVLNQREHDRARQRALALSYTAGVILSCTAVAAVLLALRSGGEAIGWGFQLQSPVFVAALVYLLFVLGLSLSGAVEFGAGIMGAGQSLTQRGGHAGAFFTGVLATVVATPCTAPFMGTALGFALTQPTLAALAIFAVLGLGLALPFLLLGFFPRLAALLPRPGAWMQTFKQLMAFPLYLSAVWLLWVLSHQTSANAAALVMIGLVLIAFALWLWQRDGGLARLLRIAALLAAAALLANPLLRATPAASISSEQNGQEPYTAARLAQLRAEHRTVFVNLTADWCITCKVNEHAVLDTAQVQSAFRQANVAWLVGDWTREDPQVTQLLEQFHRSGVPLYLVYVDGGEPNVLPQILTPERVIAALRNH
ncbi:MAG: protein-disulfide reductase DsbD family protein [Stenotrophobium sp.]